MYNVFDRASLPFWQNSNSDRISIPRLSFTSLDMSENKIFKGKSILLVSPVFFGYEAAIRDKLIELGADVTYVDDRPTNNSFAKGIIRVHRQLLDNAISKYYEQVTNDIADRQFDLVFLLNPEAMPLSFLAMCKARWKKAFFVMYMWDSVKNRKHTLDYVPYCDRVFTFDKSDVALHNFDFRPLFYLDLYSSIRRSSVPILYDVCFMGTVHSDRYAIAKGLKKWGDANGLRCYFYFYMQNKTFYYVNKLTKKNGDPSIEEISFNKLSAAEIVNVVRSSKAVLDIQHFKQTGLTMRTLETLGAGKKLITTNPGVKEYDFYDKDRVMVIDRFKPDEMLNLDFFREDNSQIPEAVLEKYSIGSWLNDLLNLDGDGVESPSPLKSVGII
jgi:hypothetical protein